MKSLLSRLDHETFILYLAEPINVVPELDNVVCVKIDESTLEVSLKSSEHLTPLFAELSQQGISVASMKNKANRLEELFLTLVEPTEHGGQL